MKLLLDTNALLWLLNNDGRLGPTARGMIQDPSNNVLVSIASLWEIAIKQRIGKLQADVLAVAASVERSSAVVLPITLPHLATLLGLPRHHRDPFDHLLIAQAIAENATLMSEDRRMPSYPVPVASCSA